MSLKHFNKTQVLSSYNKERIVFFISLIMMIISSSISVYAANYLYSSSEVSFDNSSSGISSDNVQGAIDELYQDANDYSSINTRVTDLESTVTSLENNKQDEITGGATTITESNLTANRALISNANGKVAVSGTTSTQLEYLNTVTSNVQTQLNNKMSSNPTNIELMPGSSAGNGGYIDFHYNNSSADYTARIIEDSNKTLNLVATNGVKINGDSIKHVKYVDRSYSNVAITTKSGSGAYYKLQESYTQSGYTVISVTLIGWSGATASFTPYYQANNIAFMSDVSQTVGSVIVRVVLIKN